MTDRTKSAAGIVLLTLASGQFLMTLDSSVMNVSIAQVAEDLGTTVTGIQTAITLYTLVMATLMITGGKIGSLIGRKRAFMIGCVIYGAGSLTTSLAPTLTVLIIGWSFLEGIGAALIMPAIVALVASNFPPEGQAPCLWPRGLGRRHRGCRWTPDRGLRHDELDLEICVRRRGSGSGRHPHAHTQDPGRATRGQTPVGPGRCRPHCGRARSGCLRRASLRGVGLDPAQTRWPGMARDFADGVVHPGRGPHHQDLLCLGGKGRG